MTLQELRFIVALAETKHFGDAAKKCFVSQPSLSIAIRKLEKELNVTIFDRDKNHVRLTPVGLEISERAKKLLNDANAIKEIANSNQDPLNSVFRLGVIFTVGPYLLPHLISNLHSLAPKLALEIQEDYTKNLREKLKNGDVDAIIISLPFSDVGVEIKTLYKESFVVLLPTHHPLAKYKAIDQKMLNEFNLLMLGEGHCFRNQVMASCPSCFIENSNPLQNVSGTSLETIRHMVAGNMGITILPANASMHPAYEKGILTTRPLKGLHTSRTIALVWRQSYSRKKIIDVILQASQALPVCKK